MSDRTREISIDLEGRSKEAAAARRFPVTVSTETPVQRWDWSEVLSHSPNAVDLSRAPLPVLECHDRQTVNVGIVTNLRLDGSRLRGELVLGKSQRAAELAVDIGDGIVTGLSVGYSIDKAERDEKAKRITATRWMPYEVSIVPVPADIKAGINRSRSNAMDHDQDPTTTPTEREPQAARAAPEVLAERERVSAITSLCNRHVDKLGPDFADHLIERGVSLDLARAAILDRIAAWSDALPPGPNAMHTGIDERDYGRHPIVPGDDMAEDFHRAAVDSLLLRSGISVEKPHAAARDVSPSVFDLARKCLSRAGKSASGVFGGEARGPDLIKRALTTSDFPLLLSGALHASIRNGYETEPATHRAWVRVVPVPDFRDQVRPILGSAPALEAVSEHGEYKEDDMAEDSTSYRVAKYGKIVSLSWELLVNDNLSAFLRVQPALGQAARRLEADVVYALFAANAAAGPTMQDGKNLFHADHGNLTAAGSLSADLLGAGRRLLRRQTALGGGYLSLVPRFLLLPTSLEQAAEILLANASRRTTAEKTSPEWVSNLEPVVEPRLLDTGTTPVYLAADNAQIDTIELGLLEENASGPVIEEDREFRKDVFSWKVRHVCGAKVLDWRGLVKSPTS